MIQEFKKLKVASVNPKIAFKFLSMSNPTRDRLEGMFNKFQVYQGNKIPETFDEKDLALWKKIYVSFLMSNPEEALKGAAEALHAYLPKEKEERLKEAMLENKENEPIPDKAVRLFSLCIRLGAFGDQSHRVGACLFNATMEKGGYLPLVFYHQALHALAEFADTGMETEDLEGMMSGLIPVSLRYNAKHRSITPEEINGKLVDLKGELKDKFGIEHLRMVGSYANGLYSDWSDLDLVVEAAAENQEHEELESFLSKAFHMPVDVIDSRDPFCRSKDLQRFHREVF